MFLKANVMTSLKAQNQRRKTEPSLFKRKKKNEEEQYGSFKIIINSQNWFVFIL